MKYKFSSEDREQIEEKRKASRDKQTERRLKVLSMRCEGKTLEEISRATGFHRSHISNLIRQYFEKGLASVSEKHYTGNRRNMSIDEEKAFLEPYREVAEQGQMLDVREIAAAYEKRVGHHIGKGHSLFSFLRTLSPPSLLCIPLTSCPGPARTAHRWCSQALRPAAGVAGLWEGPPRFPSSTPRTEAHPCVPLTVSAEGLPLPATL